MNTSPTSSPLTVAISYTRDEGTAHEKWVLNLANLLQANGVYVLLDQYDLNFGKSMTHFMEQAVTNADKVILIMTPAYKAKADGRAGGAGYEYSMISHQLYKNQDSNKFIPVVRRGDFETASPTFISDLLSINMTRDDEFDARFKDLVLSIYGIPGAIRPPVGPVPDFITSSHPAPTYSPSAIIDEKKEMTVNGMPHFGKWTVRVSTVSLASRSNFILSRLLNENMVALVDGGHPLLYTLDERLLVSHHPAMVYDTPDRNKAITNYFDHACLKIENGAIQYEYAEYSDQNFMMTKFSKPFETILALLLILRKIHEKEKIAPKITLHLKYHSSQRSVLHAPYSIIPLAYLFVRQIMTIPGNSAEREIPISDLSNDKIFEVFEELYTVFSAEDKKSPLRFIQLERNQFDNLLAKVK